MGSMSKNGLDLVASFEGFSPTWYWDYNQWSIGFGHGSQDTTTVTEPLSKTDAYIVLKLDLQPYFDYVENYFSSRTVPLNQNQLDALTSFAYNLGTGRISEMCKDDVNMSISDMCDRMLLYIHAGGVVLQGLVRRREAECRLMNTPFDPTDPNSEYQTTPSVDVGSGSTSNDMKSERNLGNTNGVGLNGGGVGFLVDLTNFDNNGAIIAYHNGRRMYGVRLRNNLFSFSSVINSSSQHQNNSVPNKDPQTDNSTPIDINKPPPPTPPTSTGDMYTDMANFYTSYAEPRIGTGLVGDGECHALAGYYVLMCTNKKWTCNHSIQDSLGGSIIARGDYGVDEMSGAKNLWYTTKWGSINWPAFQYTGDPSVLHKGCIVCMTSTTSPKYGHVGVFDKIDGSDFWCVNQGKGMGKIKYSKYPLSYITGVIYPIRS